MLYTPLQICLASHNKIGAEWHQEGGETRIVGHHKFALDENGTYVQSSVE